MANFAASVLEAGQAIFTDQFVSKGEWRKPDHAALVLAEKGIVTNPALQNIRTSEKRTVKTYLPKRQATTGGTSRAYNHTGAFGDSLAVTLAWSTLSEPFKVSMKLADNNVLTGAQMFASALRNAINNLLKRSNDLFIASLLADKTNVNAGGANGTFNETSFDYEIPESYESFLYQEIQSMMQKNLYNGNLAAIADMKAFALAQRLINQGIGNNTNTQYQFAGFPSLVPYTGEILGGSHKGSVISFEEMSVAFQPWIPLINRKPIDPGKITEYNGDFGSITIPELGVDFALHAYSQRADTDSAGGSTQDLVTEYEVSVDWCYASSPLSVTDETPVFTSLLKVADPIA